MQLSEKFAVPPEVSRLYDFANSLDLRSYVEYGVAHTPGDELATINQLEGWLRARGLLAVGARVDADGRQRALELRTAIRAFVQVPHAARAGAGGALTTAALHFPLAMSVSPSGELHLRPAGDAAASGLAHVIAELYRLSQTGRLDRLKMCASEECGWVFYDRSKPGNRRWCSSARCGNRQKTRDYRSRHRANASTAVQKV